MNVATKLWTDYPLSKTADEKAIYPVSVIAWDENKYCLAWWNGELYLFKLWYCHVEPECTSEIWKDEKLLAKIPGRKFYLAYLQAYKGKIKE